MMGRRVRRALLGPARPRDTFLVIICALVSAGVIFGLLYDVFDGALRRWTERDLAERAHVFAASVIARGATSSPAQLDAAVARVTSADSAIDLLVCSSQETPVASTSTLRDLSCRSDLVLAAQQSNGQSIRGTAGGRSVAVTAHAVDAASNLFIVQDRTFLDARRQKLLVATFVGAELALLALLLLARAGARIGSRRTAEAARAMVRQMRARDGNEEPPPVDLRLLVSDMRATVEQLSAETHRGADHLRAVAESEVPIGGLVVIANRQPYEHEWTGDGGVRVNRPVSGLVTGIEPILRACGGTWIAHGSGSADRAHSDRAGKLAVPPDSQEYTLRRLWIEEEEYDRYYCGFANEALWPLCHTAFTQPMFRAADWSSYQNVNQMFARAAAEEVSANGLLLIQDYHFALVPRMVRERAPHIVTSLFWHIPWPSSEVVGICPWKETLLEGMIGADVIGFHTRQYCLNFLESVQRYLECRVDLDEMSVTFGGHRTLVRAYPISVEWPYPASPRIRGQALRRSLGIGERVHVSIGIDRADYTKGLLERIGAIEQLLEDNPTLAGQYTLLQLASPTRTKIRRYQQLAADLEEAVERVNARFGTADWKPVMLQMRTFSPEEVRDYYAMADSALVTPLHDGMNLVAKEYVAACEDGDGVLVLSTFAGAAKELEGALLVNPYDTQQTAQAILRAVRMPLAERKARMQAMREQIASHSIYHWSAMLLTDMAAVRDSGARFWPQSARGAAAARRGKVVAG